MKSQNATTLLYHLFPDYVGKSGGSQERHFHYQPSPTAKAYGCRRLSGNPMFKYVFILVFAASFVSAATITRCPQIPTAETSRRKPAL